MRGATTPNAAAWGRQMEAVETTITIVEGPDGGGKSTYAEELARDTDARLVHCTPFTGVNRGLARLYVEAMLPALLNYQNVVLDRSWLSEPIYGKAFRKGADRIGRVRRRMLERTAMRCACAVVRCQPAWSVCLKTYRSRKGQEYLETEKQLDVVYHEYCFMETSLPVVEHDYTKGGFLAKLEPMAIPPSHPTGSRSAGNFHAPVVIVGDKFGLVKDCDPLLQLPFVSYNGSGCSSWLTEKLDEADINEEKLLWVNADDPLLQQIVDARTRRLVCALGAAAGDRLTRLEIAHERFAHPQHAKRFRYSTQYPLVKAVTEALSP